MTTKKESVETKRLAPTKAGRPRDTKTAQLIRLLSTKSGADATAISARLGWKPHTTRAAISGLKKAGYEIAAEKSDRARRTRYRIIGKPKPGPVTTSSMEPLHG
ncbi:DUF3489 domain-containing protein [Silicimonas algicola]|uniref:Uncharacterized protein DUF3489 n=1 Tax=Silicimonas algicola TaxID=1826607 RepID=A0A316G5K1_9RHOB|nr:DUF3489 domain-containing protein [Silicimonas algicola]AZQ68700.1 DUF3489 domain-containing protein [Silicimonas algicola]PWK56231.1 uncharacterized protein DUF3489 [Silicimonas algicola]